MNFSSAEAEDGWIDKYNHLMVDLRDPRYVFLRHEEKVNLLLSRSDDYPMMSSIWPTVTVCLLYVFICKIGGPW